MIKKDHLRVSEKEVVILSTSDNEYYYAIYDLRQIVYIQSALGIATTVLVCVILGTAALVFARQTNDLVIFPIELMIEKINQITNDPLRAHYQEEEKLLLKELQDQGEEVLKKPAQIMETVVLEETLSKVGALLALGFGEAGSMIIAHNLRQGEEVNPMLPGVKGLFVFGFCDIRNFTDTTEVLQEGVMMFVNEIGEIVHRTVNKFLGFANKNVGDAFLLVWKFEKEDQIYDEQTQSWELVPSLQV